MEFFEGLIGDTSLFGKLDREFYYALHAATSDDLLLVFIENEHQSGFLAWRKLAGRFSPRHRLDQNAEYMRLISPQSWIKVPKNVDLAMEALIEWESAVAVYESKYGEPLSNREKMTALRYIMPPQVFGGRCS